MNWVTKKRSSYTLCSMYFVCINVVFESIETFYGFFEKILAFIRYAAFMAIPVVEFLKEGYKIRKVFG